MKQSFKVIAIAVALVFCGAHLQAKGQALKKFEMRLAETEPGDGLTEAAIQNSSEKVYLHKEAIITNEDVVRARVVRGYDNRTFEIEILFTQEAAERMARATREHIGRPLALLFDDNVISAPVLRSEVSGTGMISGRFSRQEAERIAKGIKNN